MILTPFGTDIWLADGPTVTAALGFAYPTRMAVIRLAGGGLFVWSPVALTEEVRAAVDGLGPVRHIVAPNSLHDTFLPEWQAAYPQALIHAAPGLRMLRADLRFGSDLGAAPHPDWAGQIDQVVVCGNRITTEVVFFHRASGTAIFTDLLQHLPPGWFAGWRALLARADAMTGPEPAVPRKFRVAFTDKAVARRAMARVLAWPVRQVVMAHGAPVPQDGAALLKRAFRWLGA